MADDLISREAAIKMLRGEAVAKYPMSFYMGLLAAADEINKLPSVNAVVLPCKVGDTVYRLLWSQGGKVKWNFHIVKQHIKNLHDIVDCIERLGKTVFLTREEAEKALGERKEKCITQEKS